MKLNSVSIINYKNIDDLKLDFDSKINCFIGNNGVGKSNLLDSIYHLCLGKSYFNNNVSQNIQFNKDFYIIQGNFYLNSRIEKINCSYKKGKKKILKRNNKAYKRFSDHIGLLPLVIISPSDRDLISGGSTIRRKFVDSIIGQINKHYLVNIINYNKLIIQRNALLKYFSTNMTFNLETLSIYNEQIEFLGKKIYLERKKFLKIFIPIFEKQFKSFSHGNENVSIDYKSDLHYHDYKSLFNANLEKDKKTNLTNSGVHKDDLSFKIHGESIKNFGSQGQQKSFLIALKLAQFNFIKKESSVLPIILLDDVFDKLDQKRVELIMQLIEKNNFGQLFLSDTHHERTIKAIKTTKLSYSVFNLPID
ncbi:MAG: DNA replication and repair protein RecF [Flavobacteriaceae bacterium]|nr:DNA replication and repair protein RecF [Flavobacteriaceae bacterium]